MEVMLEVPVTLESQSLHDAHNGCRAGRETARHVAHIQQDELAWALENGSDDVLTLTA